MKDASKRILNIVISTTKEKMREWLIRREIHCLSCIWNKKCMINFTFYMIKSIIHSIPRINVTSKSKHSNMINSLERIWIAFDCNSFETGVWKPSKMYKTFAMMDASNTVQVLVACAMQGIWFSSMNCLWWGRRIETSSQMKACVIYGIQFTRMNCLHWDKRTETDQYNKMCVVRGKQVCN